MVLTPSAASLHRAAAMGDRAGDVFVTTGIPSLNPFGESSEPSTSLAQAWRRAYLASIAAAPTISR